MNKNQWFVFGIGLLFLGSYMLWNANLNGFCNALILNDEQMTACFVRRYAYSVPGIIFGLLAWIFIICGWLEPKKNT